MIGEPPSPGRDTQVEAKLRGLERLHIAGVVGDGQYNDLRARLEAERAAASASPPAEAPGAPAPSAPDAAAPLAPRWSFGPAPAEAAAPAASASSGWSVRGSRGDPTPPPA